MTYNRIRLLLMKDRGFMGDLHFLVAVAQLVRVLGCGPGGRGFESHQPPHAGAKFVLLRFIFLRFFRKSHARLACSPAKSKENEMVRFAL